MHICVFALPWVFVGNSIRDILCTSVFLYSLGCLFVHAESLKVTFPSLIILAPYFCATSLVKTPTLYATSLVKTPTLCNEPC